MRKKVEEFIQRKHMIASGERIVVGVSGGADSMCLLDVLSYLAPVMNFSIQAVHVNHMIRGEEADRDEAFVQAYCMQRGINLQCVHIDVKKMAKETGESLEEAGRKARYEAFESVAGADKIAVAHHGDDQAETVLYNIFRGSSIRGIGGMRPMRDKVIRPLLCVSRKEIEEYLKEHHIEYCTDSTNLSDEYTRNKIRNVMLPYVQDNINHNAVENVNELSRDMQEVYGYINSQAQKVYEASRIKMGQDDERIRLNIKMLIKEPSIIRREVIMIALRAVAGTLKNITRKHVNSVEELIEKSVSKKRDLPYGITVIRDYEEIAFLREGQELLLDDNNPFLQLHEDSFELQILNYEGDWEKLTNDYTKVFDYDKIKGNVEVRKRLPGDYITLDGSGKKKLLKTYFIDEKVPRKQRDKIWVLAEGSHILWVVGYRTSAAYKTDESTKTILKAMVRRSQNGI